MAASMAVIWSGVQPLVTAELGLKTEIEIERFESRRKNDWKERLLLEGRDAKQARAKTDREKENISSSGKKSVDSCAQQHDQEGMGWKAKSGPAQEKYEGKWWKPLTGHWSKDCFSTCRGSGTAQDDGNLLHHLYRLNMAVMYQRIIRREVVWEWDLMCWCAQTRSTKFALVSSDIFSYRHHLRPPGNPDKNEVPRPKMSVQSPDKLA